MKKKNVCHVFAKFDCIARVNDAEYFLIAGENRTLNLFEDSKVYVYPFGKEKLLSYCFCIGEQSPYVKQYSLGEKEKQVFLEKLALPSESDSCIIQTEKKEGKITILSYACDMAGRGVVQVFDENQEKEKYYVHLNEEKTSDDKENYFSEILFLEAIRAGDYDVAKKLLSPKLTQVLDTAHMRAFFPEFDEVLCYKKNNKKIFATFGKEAKIFEFSLSKNQLINNIEEV